MALSSATSVSTHATSSLPHHSRNSKLDQTTQESLYRQGFLVDEIILRVSPCVKCDSLSSCPGMLYISTEQIYFVSKSKTHDTGFHLTSILSLLIEDASYPLLTFVIEQSTCSFGSLSDREEIIDLLKGAFPKMEVSLSSDPPREDFHTPEVSETAILDPPIDKDELILKREKELTLFIQILKSNTCGYFLVNKFCPMLLFCEKEHLTQDQLDARIYTQKIAKDLSLDVLTNADILTSNDSIVRSKQEYAQPLPLRHQRHHSYSESTQHSGQYPNLNLGCLADLTAIDFNMDRPSGLRRSNSMEFIDTAKSNPGRNSSDFLGAPLIRSISNENVGACTNQNSSFAKTIPRNISPTLINFLNETLDQRLHTTCTPENNSPSSLRCVSPRPFSTPTPPLDPSTPRVSPMPTETPHAFFFNSSQSWNSQEESSPSPQPGDPCPYFLAGNCRNEDSCPFSHMDSLSSMQFLTGISTFPQTLICLSGNALNCSDKIILSPSILVVCERNNFQYPMTFSLKNLKTNEKLYVGVLEFTSPEVNKAYIPQWIFDHLGISEGDEVGFQHEDLPKGVFCQLQPLSSSWLSIPYEKRTEILEFWLKKYQNLTVGMRIDVHYEMNKYSLKVLKCKPALGISIVNADIQTDIIEPLDCDELYSPEEGQAQRLHLGYPMLCSLAIGMYRHFVLLYLPSSNHPERVRITLNAHKGDPDLYVSQSHTAPSQRLYQWCSQEVGSKEIYLNPSDPLFNARESIYVGVMSFTQDTVFTICFHRDDGLQMSQRGAYIGGEQGQRLRATNSPANSVDESTNTPPKNHVQCTHCNTFMLPLRLAMHERHCKLSTYRCPDCNECIPFVAKEKHPFILHTKLTCCCGEVFTQYDLNDHQKISCVKRTLRCTHKWCNLSFPMDEIDQHETTCGTRVTPCPICSVDTRYMELESHLFAFHSVDVRRINWDIPLNAQFLKKTMSNAGKLNCKCGENFMELDDLQVHQLTSCKLSSNSNSSGVSKKIGANKQPTVNGEISSLAECEKPQQEPQAVPDNGNNSHED